MKDYLRELMGCNLDIDSADFDAVRISDLLQDWMEDLGSENLSSAILATVCEGTLSIDAGAVLLRVAAWTGTENGSSMLETFRHWLREGAEENRLRLALSSEFLLFDTKSEAQEIYEGVERRFPQLREKCREALRGYS